MKKLTLVTLISSALSAGAMAGEHNDKIALSFNDLDKNGDGHISRDEATNTVVAKHYDTINVDGDGMLTMKEFNTHVANNPSHFSDTVVASVQMSDNGVQEMDQKTVSAAGEVSVALATESRANKSSSMTAQTDTGNMKTISKDVDINTDADEAAMTGDADIMKETTMTVKTEQDNMGGEKNVNIEKDVDVDMEAEAATIAATQFDEIDTDHDGQLTKAEIANAADNVKFHEIDINNDEMVSRAEFDSYKRTDVKSDMKDYYDE